MGMKRTILAILLAVLAVAPIAAWAQWGTIYTDAVRPSTSSGGGTPTTPLQIGPSSTSGCTVLTTGELSCTQAHTDGYAFLPAYEVCNTFNATTPTNRFTATRVASNDWALGHPNGLANAAETISVACTLNSFIQRVGCTKGIKINSLDYVYQITGVALTSHTIACNSGTTGFPSGCLGGALATTVYANNAADVIGSPLHTNTTLQTATQTNPYLTNIPITTPAFLPGNIRTALTFDTTMVTQANTLVRIYGIGVNFSVLSA
jgi:hypothetical protein